MLIKGAIKIICYTPSAPTLTCSKQNNDWNLSKCRKMLNAASILPV